MSYERLGQDNQAQNQTQNLDPIVGSGPMSPEEHAAWLAQHSQQQAEMNARMEECWAKGWHWQGEFCEEPPAPPPGTTSRGPGTMTEVEVAAMNRLAAYLDPSSQRVRTAVQNSAAAFERFGVNIEHGVQRLPEIVREYGIAAVVEAAPLARLALKGLQDLLNAVYPAAKIVVDGKWTAKTEQYLRQYAVRWADMAGASPLNDVFAAQDEYCAKPGVVCVSAPAGMSRNTKLALGLAAGVGLWLVFFRR